MIQQGCNAYTLHLVSSCKAAAQGRSEAVARSSKAGLHLAGLTCVKKTHVPRF